MTTYGLVQFINDELRAENDDLKEQLKQWRRVSWKMSTGGDAKLTPEATLDRFKKSRDRQMERRKNMLNELAEEICQINAANGWNVTHPEDWGQQYKIPAIMALITSEVSEALEAFRADDRSNFGEELADILIRVLDCAIGLGVDLDKEVRAKIEKNKTRGYRHGGKKI